MNYLIDTSLDGHRKKYIDSFCLAFSQNETVVITSKNLNKSKLLVYRFYLFEVFKIFISNGRQRFVFVTADPIFILLPILFFFIKSNSLFIFHRKTLAIKLFWPLLFIFNKNNFTPNIFLFEFIKSKSRLCLCNLFSDPLSKVLEETKQIPFDNKKNKVLCIGGSQTQKGLYIFLKYSLFQIDHIKPEVLIDLGVRYKIIDINIKSDEDFYKLINSYRYLWAYRGDGANYFSSILIEALYLGLVVVAENSRVNFEIAKKCPSLVLIDKVDLENIELISSKISKVTHEDCLKTIYWITTNFSSKIVLDNLSLE